MILGYSLAMVQLICSLCNTTQATNLLLLVEYGEMKYYVEIFQQETTRELARSYVRAPNPGPHCWQSCELEAVVVVVVVVLKRPCFANCAYKHFAHVATRTVAILSRMETRAA